jgi:hypothetical protein
MHNKNFARDLVRHACFVLACSVNVDESNRIEGELSGGDVMKMYFPVICTAAFFFACGAAVASQTDSPKAGSWSGVIINSGCSADEAFAEASKCTEKDLPGAKLVLYDDTTRKMYLLDPQDQAIGHLGDSMTATGTLEGDTVHVTSLKMHTSIGLSVGQEAPAFSARDQFGKLQTLDMLKGPKGTVLLFFRSADW